MFETLDNAEIVLPSENKEDLLRSWKYIFRRSKTSWLYATSHVVNEALSFDVSVFVPDIHEVMALQEQDRLELYDVYLVSPGHINNSSLWQMERIKSVEMGHEPYSGEEIYVYVLDNGERRVDSIHNTPEESIIGISDLWHK
ncbi:MAG: hypothetical protein COA63_008245 [Methylophaga sp.]|nr:hypothetical protein [Methylophaga sp.]